MAKVKLASETLGVPRQRGSLSAQGTLLDPRSGMVSTSAGQIRGQFRAPSVNPNVANVDYKPIRPNDIVIDNSLDALAKTADLWVQSAFKFQERQDQFTANEVVMAYEEDLRKSQTGYRDEQGNWVDGYLYREAEDATGGYEAHRATIEGSYQAMLLNQPERVRQKAMLRMTDARNNALARATKHNVAQFRVAEQRQLYTENQALLQDIERFGPEVFENGKIQQHLNKYADDPEKQAAVAHSLGKFALFEAYNKALNESGERNPTHAYQAARMMYESVRPHLAEQGEQDLDHWLNQRQVESERNEAKEKGRIFQQRSREMDRDVPVALSEVGLMGNYEVFFNELEVYRGLYSDEDVGGNEFIASAKVVEAVQGSIVKAIDDTRYVTIQEKINAANSYINGIMSDGGDKNFETHELIEIQNFVEKDLPKQIVDKQKSADNFALYELGITIDTAKKAGELPKIVAPPVGMLESNKDKFNSIQQNWVQESINGVDATAQTKRAGVGTHYEAILNDRTLTDTEMQTAFEAVANGELALTKYNQIYRQNQIRKDPAYEKPEVLKTNEYKAVDKGLKEAYDLGMFDPREKPDEDEVEDSVAWQIERQLRYDQAKLDLRSAAIAAARAKQPFSAREWWNKYQKDTMNDGKTSSSSWLSKFFGTVVDIPMVGP